MLSYLYKLLNICIYKTFKIKKGKHRSGYRFWFTFSKKISYECKLKSSCIYNIESLDKFDVNKVFGFSTSKHHHQNSARLGWTSLNGNNIQLWSYIYDNGQRVVGHIANVEANEKFKCTIIAEKGRYKYILEKKDEIIEKDINVISEHSKFKYLLYPYFGGNLPAPHDIEIILRRI